MVSVTGTAWFVTAVVHCLSHVPHGLSQVPHSSADTALLEKFHFCGSLLLWKEQLPGSTLTWFSNVLSEFGSKPLVIQKGISYV